MPKARDYETSELRWVSENNFTLCIWLCVSLSPAFVHDYYFGSNKSFPSFFSLLLGTLVLFQVQNLYIPSQFVLADLLINSLLKDG